jgi:hypothetical protein
MGLRGGRVGILTGPAAPGCASLLRRSLRPVGRTKDGCSLSTQYSNTTPGLSAEAGGPSSARDTRRDSSHGWGAALLRRPEQKQRLLKEPPLRPESRPLIQPTVSQVPLLLAACILPRCGGAIHRQTNRE